MKKIENSFAVTGFIGKDAEIRSFETASVARFSIAVSRADKTGEETSYVSAFMGIEAWRKNEALRRKNEISLNRRLSLKEKSKQIIEARLVPLFLLYIRGRFLRSRSILSRPPLYLNDCSLFWFTRSHPLCG